MHASLILLATSLAASVVGAPVPTVSPFESPAPMMVRDANSEAISPVLENLKRQILERLDAIVQRSVSDYVDDDATLENDKHEGHSLGVRAAHDKREGGPGGSANPSAHDKRYPRDQNVGSSDLKRTDTIVQRSIPEDDDVTDVNEKRRLASVIVPPGVNYKRDNRDLVSPTSNYKRERNLVSPTSNYKRERNLVSKTSNYKRDYRDLVSPSTNYRRDSDEETVASDLDYE